MRKTLGIASKLLFVLCASTALADDPLVVPKDVQSVITSRCMDCHGAATSEGDVQLHALVNMNQDERLALLNRVQGQLFFGLMPPTDEDQPTTAEHTRLADWVSVELNKHNASKIQDKLRRPGYGNYVDHDKLFSDEHKDLKGFTYDRRWLISEYIFDAKFNQLLNYTPFRTIDGTRQFVIGDNNRRVNLTNPFLLPTNTGVRYYANTTLNGGHLLTMLTNAKETSSYMVYLTKRDKRYVPAIATIMSQEWEHERVLVSRESFLNSSINRVLRDIYQDKHDVLLPQFVTVKVEQVKNADGTPLKKAAFHAAQPGPQELNIIYRAMQKHKQEDDSDEQLIEKCENEWFNFGVNARTIRARVTFMNNYMSSDLHTRMPTKPLNTPFRARDDAEMNIIGDAILKYRIKGDHYNTIISKCMAEWERGFKQQRIEAGPPSDVTVNAIVDQLFVKISERLPTTEEAEKYVSLTRSYIGSLGNLKAIEKLIQTLILRSEFVYRYEFGQGEVNEDGRRLLSPRDASYAIAYALTDSSPDEQLVQAANSGRLNTKEDYRREVTRLLKKRDQYYIIDEAVQRLQLTASITNTPIRKLRFFREFFGYPKMLPIFKDNKRFGGSYDRAKGRLVGEADRLVDHILQKDQNVFEELLSTENFYVYHSGDNAAMKSSSKRIRKIYDHFKDEDWQNFTGEDLERHKDFITETEMRGIRWNDLKGSIRTFKTVMESFSMRFDKGQQAAAPYNSFPSHGKANASTRTGLQLRSPDVAKFFNIQLDNWNYPTTQPAKVSHRKGILTHPAWLIAHAQNTETDPVRRGKWVQEKLLAGTVPDVPITVDAVIPEDHHKTLRQRLELKTGQDFCWKCHRKMNPLGLPFEMYDDFGRYRTEESLEHPDNLIKKGPEKAAVHVDLRDVYETLPVNPRGHLDGTGDETLDGDVKDAIDLIDRLARSERVRQSIIRYAFRYFMGRNEMLSDSRTLIDADRAYVESGGSFDAVIVSLLTSDSFIYRKAARK